LKIARVQIHDALRWGLHVSGPTPSVPVELSDLRITDIHGAEGSTWGVGMRLGSAANVRRAFLREVRFAGITTLGDSHGTTLSHIDIDRVGLGDPEQGGVGVYFDDTTRETTLERFCIGSNTKVGVNSEWDHLAATSTTTCSSSRRSTVSAAMSPTPPGTPKGRCTASAERRFAREGFAALEPCIGDARSSAGDGGARRAHRHERMR
jgi:hypothetical protein